MTREQAMQEIKRLEGERIALDLSTDRFSYAELDRYGELCDKIRALKTKFGL